MKERKTSTFSKGFVIKIVILIFTLLICSFSFQEFSVRQETNNIPLKGDLIKINGTLMHIECKGDGSPAIILVTGLGSDLTSFDSIFDKLSQNNKVCRFDRKGYGKSEMFSGKRTINEQREDFIEILKAKGISGKKILVGHSAGGLYIRNYFKYDKEIVGLVFIDSAVATKELFELLQEQHKNSQSVMDEIKFYLGIRLGTLRLFNLVKKAIFPNQENQNNNYLNHNFLNALKIEEEIYLSLMKEKEEDLGNIPTTVISRGIYPEISEESKNFNFLKKWYLAWPKAQEILFQLSSKSSHITALKSGHNIQEDEPELVLREISLLLKNI